MRRSQRRLAAGSAAAAFLALAMNAPHSAASTESGATLPTTSAQIQPVDRRTVTEQPALSEAQRTELVLHHLDIREQASAAESVPVEAVPAAPDAAPGQRGGETVLQGVGTDAMQIGRNKRNDHATTVASTLAEPAAANKGKKVHYTGNTFASSSKNRGKTWTSEALPGGPADAPTACCDLDVVRAHAQDRFFSSLLYTNGAVTNGVVRIFVRTNPRVAETCFYDIDPGGAADNILPDYPHLAVSNNFLYLSTNDLTDGAWTGAQVYRFDVAQMAACTTTNYNLLTWTGSVGQRILTPVEGATDVMYLGSTESATTFRAFSWPESSTSVTSFTYTVDSSTFTNPDCRGGVDNFDFIERDTAWSITGFRLRGATGGGQTTFWWPVAPDVNHPQAHLHGATIRTSDMALIDQPPVWNSTTCFGYPAVSSNVFGEYGMSMAAGGQAGGGGTSAQGVVLVDDTESAGIFFPLYSVTATGTHNRTDGRFGDYFTVRTNARCTSAWVATNYALLDGNTTSAHVNARYVEFQSTLDPPC